MSLALFNIAVKGELYQLNYQASIDKLDFDIKKEAKLTRNWIILEFKILELGVNLKEKAKVEYYLLCNNRAMISAFASDFETSLIVKLNSHGEYSAPQRYHSYNFDWMIIRNFLQQNSRWIYFENIYLEGFYFAFLYFIHKLRYYLLDTIYLCALL